MSEVSLAIQIQGIDQASQVFRMVGSEADAFKGRIQGLDQGMSKLNTATDTNIEKIKELNKHYRNAEMTFRVSNYQFLKTVSIMQSIGGVGQSLVGMWQAYNIGQMRIERTSRNVAEANEEVAKWQAIYNQYLKDFGPDSAYTLDALDQLNQAIDNQTEAVKQDAKAQTDMWAGYASMGLQSVGLVGDIAQITTAIQSLGAAAGVAGGATGLGALTAGLTTLGSIAMSVLAPITALLSSASMIAVLPAALANLTLPEEKKIMGWGISEETPPYEKEGYFPSEWWQWIPFAGDIAKAFGVGQLGIPRVEKTGPHWLEKDETVLTPLQSATLGGAKTVRATITQYNTIASGFDFERANDRALKQLLRKFGNKW